MREGWQRPDHRDRATEFLPDLADNGSGGILAWLDLAAGKFPFERHQLVRRSLGDENAPVPLDDGADDRNGSRGSQAWAGMDTKTETYSRAIPANGYSRGVSTRSCNFSAGGGVLPVS